jgi:hypothetical protein
VEAPPARETVDGLHDSPSGTLNLGLGLLQAVAIENDQGATFGRRCREVGLEESSVEPLVREGGVVRAVIDKRPAECGFKERLGRFQVLGGKLNVVDLFVLERRDVN